MITGIPAPDDLSKAGLDYLNLAWSDLISYLEAEQHYASYGAPDPHDVEEGWSRGKSAVHEHRRVAYRGLTTCSLLIHQGAEFILKSRICTVSPYLLLDSPKGWSNYSKGADFSDFYTLDAEYLVKVHDTVCPKPLPDRFKQRLEMIRNGAIQLRMACLADRCPRMTCCETSSKS